MTEPRRAAGWLDWISLGMLLLIAAAVVAVAVGGVLALGGDGPGEAWYVAGVSAVAAAGLFLVAVVVEAVRGPADLPPPGPGVARGGDGIGGRAED